MSHETAPRWADFLSPEEWDDFLGEVLGSLAARGLVRPRLDGEAVVAESPGRGERRFGLVHVAQSCRDLSPAERREYVRHHFDGIFRAEAEQLHVAARPLDEVRGLLRIRLMPDEPVRELLMSGTYGAHFQVTGDVVGVLVYDLPNAVVSVAADDVRRWDVSREELFDIALSNLKNDPPLRRGDIEVAPGVVITGLSGSADYTASHVLRLSDYLNESSRAEDAPGVVIAMPLRHAVFFHEIKDRRVVMALRALAERTPSLYRRGPNSLSPSLWWWRAGRIVRLPTESERWLTFADLPEFAAVLDGLPAPKMD